MPGEPLRPARPHDPAVQQAPRPPEPRGAGPRALRAGRALRPRRRRPSPGSTASATARWSSCPSRRRRRAPTSWSSCSKASSTSTGARLTPRARARRRPREGVIDARALPERAVSRSVATAAALAGALVLVSPGLGQDTPRRAVLTFGSDVDVVRLDVTVVGRDGRFVTDLREEDFELYEDGQRQALSSFLRQELPGVPRPAPRRVDLGRRPHAAWRRRRRRASSRRCGRDDEVRVVAFNDQRDRAPGARPPTATRCGRAIERGSRPAAPPRCTTRSTSTFKSLPAARRSADACGGA